MCLIPSDIKTIIYEYDPTYKFFIWEKIGLYIKNYSIHCECGFIAFPNVIKYKNYIKYICPNCYLDWYV